jgi:hypothetical protein
MQSCDLLTVALVERLLSKTGRALGKVVLHCSSKVRPRNVATTLEKVII